MEELLSKLIEKGWKPFGIKSDEFYIYISKFFQIVISYYRLDLYWDKERDDKRYSYREITSKDSWLWQFVCENKLTNQDKDNIKKWTHQSRRYVYGEDCWIENNNLYNDDYEYYIIESSLKNESELEDFLLSNIVIKDEKSWTN